MEDNGGLAMVQPLENALTNYDIGKPCQYIIHALVCGFNQFNRQKWRVDPYNNVDVKFEVLEKNMVMLSHQILDL